MFLLKIWGSLILKNIAPLRGFCNLVPASMGFAHRLYILPLTGLRIYKIPACAMQSLAGRNDKRTAELISACRECI